MIGLRAVVVDDNALNRDLVVRVLEANGMKTAQAGDAMAGWKEVEAFDPQLAVVDVMMPGPMDGVGLCQLIRACPRYSKIAVVMITASDKKREAERALSAGANILLSKPFSPREMWAQIEALLKGRKDAEPAPRVFILDHNENDLRIAQAVLKRAGYDVAAESDPAGAIAAVKNFRPHLVLLDVALPRISGPEFAGLITRDRSLPFKPGIVFYSERSANELHEISEGSGAFGYAIKSEGPTSLIRAVHRALNRATA